MNDTFHGWGQLIEMLVAAEARAAVRRLPAGRRDDPFLRLVATIRARFDVYGELVVMETESRARRGILGRCR